MTSVGRKLRNGEKHSHKLRRGREVVHSQVILHYMTGLHGIGRCSESIFERWSLVDDTGVTGMGYVASTVAHRCVERSQGCPANRTGLKGRVDLTVCVCPQCAQVPRYNSSTLASSSIGRDKAGSFWNLRGQHHSRQASPCLLYTS